MLRPDKVQQVSLCTKPLNDIIYSDSQGDMSNISSMTEITKSSFFNTPDYNKVYKNFDYNQSYDTWIYEGNEEDKIVGYKMIQSYPYDDVKFKIGDYIHWNFNHKELSTWLITSLDTQYLYNVKGKILLCNNSLRWIDNHNVLRCFPCVIKDTMTYTNLKWGNKGVIEPGGDIVILVQRNEYTSTITINQRFVFDSVSFVVKQKFNELNPNYVELYMSKVPELKEDNLIDNIATNGTSTDTIVNNGNIILPNINTILNGDTQIFTIYNYINGNKNNDTFTVTISDVPNKNYEFNIINGNSFSIKNISQYINNPLKITYVNNQTLETKYKDIWLGGNW